MPCFLLYFNIKVIPRIFPWRKGSAAYVFACYGVLKGKSAAPKGSFASVVAASVFAVSQKGHLSGGELHAYLVGAPCVKLNENKGRALAFTQNAIFQRGFFNALTRTSNHKALVFAGIFKKKVFENSLFFLGAAFYNGEILL